jgi:hypothetical protein
MALHVLVGQEDFFAEFLGAAQSKNTCSWIIPKSSAVGDHVLLYFRHLDAFVGCGVVTSAPESTVFGRRPCYVGDVGGIQLFKKNVQLATVAELFPDWAWATYPRSFTSKHPTGLHNTMMRLSGNKW